MKLPTRSRINSASEIATAVLRARFISANSYPLHQFWVNQHCRHQLQSKGSALLLSGSSNVLKAERDMTTLSRCYLHFDKDHSCLNGTPTRIFLQAFEDDPSDLVIRNPTAQKEIASLSFHSSVLAPLCSELISQVVRLHPPSAIEPGSSRCGHAAGTTDSCDRLV